LKDALRVVDSLRAVYTYRPESGDFVWSVNPGRHRDLVGKVAGSCRKDGYRRMKVDGHSWRVAKRLRVPCKDQGR
jgi:hypothetical protein